MKFGDWDDAAWLRLLLWCVEHIGERRYQALLEAHESAAEAIAAGPIAAAQRFGRTGLEEALVRGWPDARLSDRLATWLSQSGCGVLERGQAGFPSGLAALVGPPWLFLRGDAAALSGDLVAIVGTRRVRADGVRLTRRVVQWWLDAGWSTVSGGALGVDGCAHQATLDGGKATVVVLPAGLAHLVPGRHSDLFKVVCASGGCLVSDSPPWREPRPELFARRNRLISGMAACTVVVRAPRESGALITADWARRQERVVYAVPGSPEDETAWGCLDALQGGALLLFQRADVPLSPTRRAAVQATASSATGEGGNGTLAGAVVSLPEAVQERFRLGPISLDELVVLMDVAVAEGLSTVTRWLLEGKVAQVGPGVYGLRACSP